MTTMDPVFRKQVKEILEHLYDTAYLETHPLSGQIMPSQPTSRTTQAQKLRSLIKDLIETLRPQEGSPSSSPEWRCYHALRYRYVQGMSMGQVESELGISLRQLQRELHKGVDAIAALLWQHALVEQSAEGQPEATSSDVAPADSDEMQELQEELNQWVLDRTETEVHLLFDDVSWMINSLMEQEHINLQLSLPDNLPSVRVDATLTRQALFKLLRTILQNNPQKIQITARAAGRSVEILMNIPHIGPDITGEPDWRIAEMLFERQGGSLEANSEEEEIRVQARLPRAGQQVILVVDDNPAIHQLFERYLASSPYTVIHAYIGPEALQAAQTRKPDFITLDVMMAAMDGWQVLRELQNNPQTNTIPVIICSVLREPELAVSLGAKAYLKKPVERLQLQETLERLQRSVAGPSVEPPAAPPGN